MVCELTAPINPPGGLQREAKYNQEHVWAMEAKTRFQSRVTYWSGPHLFNRSFFGEQFVCRHCATSTQEPTYQTPTQEVDTRY